MEHSAPTALVCFVWVYRVVCNVTITHTSTHMVIWRLLLDEHPLAGRVKSKGIRGSPLAV
jgi:hypothetical protein